MATTQEQLEQVRAAMVSVATSGKRVKFHDGTEVENCSIEELQKLESRLLQQLAQEQGSSGIYMPVAVTTGCPVR